MQHMIVMSISKYMIWPSIVTLSTDVFLGDQPCKCRDHFQSCHADALGTVGGVKYCHDNPCCWQRAMWDASHQWSFFL